MSASKRLSYYPRGWWTMMKEVGEQNMVYEIPFRTKTEAWQFRGQFYGFQQSLRREADGVEILKGTELEAPTEAVAAALLLPASDKVMATLHEPTAECADWILKIFRRDESWQMQAMRKAKKTPGKLLPAVEADTHAADLRVIELVRAAGKDPFAGTPPDEKVEAAPPKLNRYGIKVP